MKRLLLMAMLAVLVAAPAARADRIRMRSGIGHSGTITGLTPDGLEIKAKGTTLRIPLGDIASIRVDKYPKLAEAEDAYDKGLAGGPGAAEAFKKAEGLYAALIREGVPTWMRVLLQSRLLKLYADSGRAAEALEAYLSLAKDQPELVQGLSLPAPKAGEDAKNRAMLRKVEAALQGAQGKPYAAELQRLRLALLLEVGTPEQVLPIVRQALGSPNPQTRQWALVKVIDLLVEAKQYDEAAARLAEARQELPAAAPRLVYEAGRIFAGQGEHAKAAVEFMRLPILYPRTNPALTADALWRAGQAMEAANMPGSEIRAVYTEAVQGYADTTGAERARRALVRLRN